MRSHPAFIRLAVLAGLFASAAVQAADIRPAFLTQSEFRLLSEDLGALVSFKPLIPAESMGLTGFDVGVAVSGTKLENRGVWEKAAGGSSVPSTLAMPSLRLHKGLPFNIDIGASIATVPSTNLTVIGGEVRWAVIPGDVVFPAVALRASVSTLTGVDALSVRTGGLDVSVSKGFAFVTPYAGAGIVAVKSKPDGAGLSSESFTQNKVFAGVNLNFGLTNIAVETDKTGDAVSYGVKLGFRF